MIPRNGGDHESHRALHAINWRGRARQIGSLGCVAGRHGLYDAAMAVYRVCLLGLAGKLEAVRRISEDSTEAAVAAAHEMLKSDRRLSGFEIWRGARLVHTDGRIDRPNKA
jgi:hypothetical protein